MTRLLTIEADGGSRGNPGVAGFGAVVKEGNRVLAERAGYIGHASNNVAEYRGLIAGLEAARTIDPTAHVEVRMDSKLVVEQMSGRWKIKHPDMRDLALRARDIAAGTRVTYTWIPREENSAADALANEAMNTRHENISRDPSEDISSVPVEDVPEDDARAGARSLASVVPGDLVSPFTIVLVRHGVTDMTVSSHLSGSSVPGPGLNPAGRVQAAKVADELHRMGRDMWDRLERPSRLFASPMVRTQDTAGAISRRLGLTIETAQDLREIDFGQWEGLLPTEVATEAGDDIHRWRRGQIPAPGGETLTNVGERMNTLLEGWAAEHAALCATEDKERTWVATSHAMAIKCALGVSLNMDISSWGSLWPQPASYTVLQFLVAKDGTISERHMLAFGIPVE